MRARITSIRGTSLPILGVIALGVASIIFNFILGRALLLGKGVVTAQGKFREEVIYLNIRSR